MWFGRGPTAQSEKPRVHDTGKTSLGSAQGESEDPEPNENIQLQDHSFLTKLFLGSKPVPIPAHRTPSPKAKANPFSILCWGWMTPLIKTGFNRVLEENDIWTINGHEKNELKMAEYHQKLKQYKDKGGAPYQDMRALVYAMRWKLFPTLLIAAIYFTSELAVSAISRHLISAIGSLYTHATHNHGPAIGYAVGSTLLTIVFQTTLVWFQYESRYTAELIRTMFISAIYDKMTRLSSLGRQQFPASRITSIITTDTNRIVMASRWTPVLILFPFVYGSMVGLLYSFIGVAALPGCGLILLGIAVNLMLSRRITRLRQSSLPFADHRIAIVRETIENMRIIKFYGWEVSFVKLISKARIKEARLLKFLGLVEGMSDALSTSTPYFAGLLSFALRIALKEPMTPALVFPSMTVFQLFIPLMMVFTNGVNTHADAWVSVKRINELFRANEDPAYTVALPEDSKSAVIIKNGTFKWDARQESAFAKKRLRRFWKFWQSGRTAIGANDTGLVLSPMQSLNDQAEYLQQKDMREDSEDFERAGARKFSGLREISLNIKKGELVMVVGAIGSGKTSLLSVILGNITKTSGVVELGGSVSSVLSTWSQNSTIRDNILFGLPYDAQKYSHVVDVCGLESDFASFPSRDFVEVGERGITLSGGQKARISLARCVYRGGDIILLDDVLSAVDGKVGNAIFRKCITGYLKESTRIMSTHNLALLPQADKVIFMDGFGHCDMDTLQNLLSRNQSFHTMYTAAIQSEEIESLEQMESNELLQSAEEHGAEEQVEEPIVKKQLSRPGQTTAADAHLMKTEARSRGSVQREVVLAYLRSGSRIGLPFVGIIIFAQFSVATSSAMQSVFLNFWSSDRYHRSSGFYVGIYALIMALRGLSYLSLAGLCAYFCLSSSSRLHNTAVDNIYRAPISYFDTTPLGRIINRFTDDIANLDTLLYMQLRMFLFSLGMLAGTVIVIFVYVPYTILVLIPMFSVALVFLNYYRSGGREIKRVNSLFRSRMFSVVTETISGLPTIQAFHMGDHFRTILNKRIDDMNVSFCLALACQYWMSIRVLLASTSIVFLTIMLCVFQVFNLPPASVGMLLSLLPSVSISLAMLLPFFGELENQINSVERLYELGHQIQQEAPYHIESTAPPNDWPQHGEIEFLNAQLRYRPELPLVMKDFNLKVRPGEKIGIIGRTGAGKSTVLSALFRLTELCGGKIIIDGVDISTLGLDDLRRKLAIIPQEPVLFQGTIRFNLDPFNERTDVELWDALRRSGVIREHEINNGDVSKAHKFHLDTVIDADGSNLSLGERQLLTLARALVRRSRVLALDEATASVDLATDRMIQNTIAREFRDCTVLSIAHRLQTIIHYDRIVVLSGGEAVEFGEPLELFRNEKSFFHEMALEAHLTEGDFAK